MSKISALHIPALSDNDIYLARDTSRGAGAVIGPAAVFAEMRKRKDSF